MQKDYEIEIVETLQRVVKVKADSYDEALDIVTEKYKNEEIILDENDFVGADFSEYKDKNFKQQENEKRENKNKKEQSR